MVKKKKEIGIEFSEKDVIDNHKNIIQKIIPNEIKLIAKNDSQKELIRSIKENEITICSGIAGSGKTYISLAYALNLLRNSNNKFKKIFLIKSVTTLKNEELGYLKGSLEEKFEPYLMSFKLNMEKFIDENSIRNIFDGGYVRSLPLAFIRGITLDNAIILIDEAQNISMDNCKTILTRLGENSKIILLGDVNQIDLKQKHESSLEPLFKIFENVDGIGTIEMSSDDLNCRNPLINVIEENFQNYYQKKSEKKKIKTDKNTIIES